MLLERASQNDPSQATVLAFSGNLGSGKTTITQSIAKVLGVVDPVKSPTFLILETYQISFNHFHKLIHIDAYRLRDVKELANLGFTELLKNNENLIVVEWAERVGPIIPKNAIQVFLKFVDEDTREITWH